MYTKERTHLLESVDVGSNQSKMDPWWLSQKGFWGFSDDTMAKYCWNHRFGQWLRCFRETFTLWELGLGIASHMRKRECECLGVWFQMLSFSVWVWAGAIVTMDWRRGREWVEGEAESGSCVGERERKKFDFMKVYLDLLETVGGLWNFLRVNSLFVIWWGVKDLSH